MPPHRTIYVVTHTHWDREWYRPERAFQVQLVALIDDVLEALETGRLAAFTLDGQSSLVEDYLRIRPEQAPRLQALIQAGKLHIGPWYVLADQALVSGESLIRNLLQGMALTARYGRVEPIGYAPDTFGHIAQLPQILAGFGIDTAVVWRGVEVPTDLFWWESPHGERLLTLAQMYYMPQIFWDEQGAPEMIGRWHDWIESRGAVPDTSVVLNGGDHLGPHPHLTEVLHRVGQERGLHLPETGLAAFFAHAKATLDGATLLTVRGELRAQPRPFYLLPQVLSARLDLKWANHESQRLLEEFVEPMVAALRLYGAQAPTATLSALLQETWRLLLQNHPHDSICGCSVDAVHRENLARYEAVQAAGGAMAAQALALLAGGAPWAATTPDERQVALAADATSADLLLWNPQPWPVSIGIETVVDLPAGSRLTRVLAPSGAEIPFAVLGVEAATNFVQGLRSLPQYLATTRLHLALWAADLPPLGYARYRLEWVPGDNQDQAGPSQAGVSPQPPTRLLRPVPLTPDDDDMPPTTIANAALTVTLMPDATLTVQEIATGQVWTGLNRLVDGGEAGDSYSYSPPPVDRQVEGQLVAVVREVVPGLWQRLRYTVQMELPMALTEARHQRSAELLPHDIEVVVTLWEQAPWVAIQVAWENRACDHRLRAHFAAPFPAEHIVADSAFAVVGRAVRPETVPLPTQPWEEQDNYTHPHQSWVALSDEAGARSLVLFAPAIPEHEGLTVPEGREIALTLLRSFGWLSREDLLTRKGGAGPILPTPEGQMRGPQVRHYWLGFGRTPATWMRVGRTLASGVRPLVLPALDGPTTRSWVVLEGDSVLLSAYKPAEDRAGVVVRLYNPSDAPANGVLHFPAGPVCVATCTLAETALGQFSDPVAAWPVSLEPWQIVSYRLQSAAPEAEASEG